MKLPNDPKTQLPRNLRVVFFGSSSYVIPIIEVLKKNFELSLVVTTEKNLSDAVPSFCLKNKIPYLSVYDLSDPTIRYTLNAKRSPLAILADFGLIVPNEILIVFSKGILNIHPSLLPKYRGPSPVQTAILNGDAKTGVSIIKLDEEIDHGPILIQKEEKILADDTTESLYRRLFKLGAELLPQTINQYINPDLIKIEGHLKLTIQDASKATLTKPLTRQDGFIDLSNPPQSAILDRMIRAFYPWPGVWAHLRLGFGGQGKLKVKSEKLKIIKFLPNKKIQVEGKKPMSYKDFLNGYPNLQPELVELLKKLQ